MFWPSWPAHISKLCSNKNQGWTPPPLNEDLPLATRYILASKIRQLASEAIQKPSLPIINPGSELVDFIGERPIVLFNLLEIPVGSLQNEGWYLWDEYNAMEENLRNLSPLNESCERALGLATKFNTHIDRNEEWLQELIWFKWQRLTAKSSLWNPRKNSRLFLDIYYIMCTFCVKCYE